VLPLLDAMPVQQTALLDDLPSHLAQRIRDRLSALVVADVAAASAAEKSSAKAKKGGTKRRARAAGLPARTPSSAPASSLSSQVEHGQVRVVTHWRALRQRVPHPSMPVAASAGLMASADDLMVLLGRQRALLPLLAQAIVSLRADSRGSPVRAQGRQTERLQDALEDVGKVRVRRAAIVARRRETEGGSEGLRGRSCWRGRPGLPGSDPDSGHSVRTELPGPAGTIIAPASKPFPRLLLNGRMVGEGSIATGRQARQIRAGRMGPVCSMGEAQFG
jgi:hypothetical protein